MDLCYKTFGISLEKCLKLVELCELKISEYMFCLYFCKILRIVIKSLLP